MSNQEPPRDGLSRRDLLHGRLFGHRDSEPTAEPPAETPPPERRHPPLVMRYPRTTREVGAVDAEPEKSSTPNAARRRTIPVLRPPGAIDEESFLNECTRCNRCIEVCPHDAIIHAPPRMREAAGTPMIDPDHQPCMMCDDFPCITACEPGVLTTHVRPMMGTAVVTEHLCLAHHGTTCTVCSERCPVEGAIQVSEGKPKVKESACTGCGVCRYVCPAPENAILLMPAFIRPTPKTRHRSKPLDE
ncbi:4Fe-4S dicluster domain-containing protein [Novipirellula sp. SH528]|uniref:4Fe-4S dicluster domain-containing protein n=1 Tax=Novipirellula sp. SH528 TaxID=3454466 RepID=UPI003FA13380